MAARVVGVERGTGARQRIHRHAAAGGGRRGRTRVGAARRCRIDSTLRILVADDSQDGADSLTFLLKAAGHEVFTAYEGAAAIALAARKAARRRLLDIGMPEVSGYDVARAIRREAWGRSMRLVALTGWGQAEHRRRSLEVGFDEHLVKPVELDLLENVLQFGTSAPISGKSQPIS